MAIPQWYMDFVAGLARLKHGYYNNGELNINITPAARAKLSPMGVLVILGIGYFIFKKVI